MGISKSSIHVAKNLFLDAVLACTELDIHFPTSNEEFNSIAQGFESKTTANIFKGCVGVIDGFFAPTTKPTMKECFGNQRAYCSRHYRMYGLNVQAVADSNLKFFWCGRAW